MGVYWGALRRDMPRKKINGILCRLDSWVKSCSGCFEFNEGYGLGDWARDGKNNIYLGSGCEECGFQGKRRETMWVPVHEKDWEDYFRREYSCE
jgi:hypothetical protein